MECAGVAIVNCLFLRYLYTVIICIYYMHCKLKNAPFRMFHHWKYIPLSQNSLIIQDVATLNTTFRDLNVI